MQLSNVWKLPFRSLRFEDGNVNARAARLLLQCFDVEYSSLPNDDVKFSYLKFWRQRKLAAVDLSLFAFTWKPFVPSKRKCSSPILYNVINMEYNRKRLNLTQSSILMSRFRCSCHRSFLNSLMTKGYWTLESTTCDIFAVVICPRMDSFEIPNILSRPCLLKVRLTLFLHRFSVAYPRCKYLSNAWMKKGKETNFMFSLVLAH